MYSPINYMKNYFFPDFITNSVKTPKGKMPKEKANSLKSKKIILSRNDNIPNKNLIIKTKTNNNNISYKQIISTNNQFSSENTSLSHKNKQDDILNNKPDSLYKFLSPKIRENSHKNLNQRKINHNNNNNINNNSKISSTKLDFSMSQINNTNIQIKEKKINFNKFKGINKVNKTSKNYYKKILNFPLSPNNNVKLLKINNTNNLHEVATSFNYKNQEKDDFYYKRILSSKKLFNNKLSNNSENKNNNAYDNKINSFICHNTNNINLNVNIINKGIILNSFSNNDNNNTFNNLLSFNKLNNSTNRNPRGHSKGTMTLTTFKDISINKENNQIPEEIHFKAVKYMQKIKNFDENYT